MDNNLNFNEIEENKDLIVQSTYNCIKSLFSKEEQENILVAEIDSEYMDGIKLCEHYNMEYGSINPIGLPKEWKIFIDPKVMEVERIICGSGLQRSKLSLPSKYLLKLPNAELLDNLAKK